MGLLERHVALARLQERVNSAERQQMQRQQRAAAEASPAPSSARIAERADQETGPREAGLAAPAFDCHLLISDQRGHVVRCRCMRSTSLRRLRREVGLVKRGSHRCGCQLLSLSSGATMCVGLGSWRSLISVQKAVVHTNLQKAIILAQLCLYVAVLGLACIVFS